MKAKTYTIASLVFATTFVAALELRVLVSVWYGEKFTFVSRNGEHRERCLMTSPSAIFEPDFGYIWQPNAQIRVAHVVNDDLLFDSTFKTNNIGFHSPHPFVKQKPKGIHRVVVVGDSSTSGIFLETAWPERLEERLNENHAPAKYEVHNFAIDGGGMPNWKSTLSVLKREKFEYDTLIIASCCESLRWPFYYATADGEWIRGLRGDLPLAKTDPESLERFIANFGYRIIEHGSNEQIDALVASTKYRGLPPLAFYATRFLLKNYLDRTQELSHLVQSVEKMPKRNVAMFGGVLEENADLIANHLVQLIESEQNSGHKVILAAIPDRNVYRKDGYQENHLTMRMVANKMGISFVDGVKLFSVIGEANREKLLLPHNAHWNQQGSDFFADYFFSELKDNAFH